MLGGPYGCVFLMKFLTRGVYTVHVRVEDGAEIPVFSAGRLNVT